MRDPLENLSGKVLVSIEGMNKNCDDCARMVRKLLLTYDSRFYIIQGLLKMCYVLYV